ncbi:ABC transporter substrate-binding protein [Bradyrhizobium sp. WYCCWR 12699]|uniref:ABC transporter substrate-binding protein n=1 Tax=Bradyrhizobium sp. WYCCWR 12699 TaxID=3064203 RepID=UPI0028A37AC8|nr:ABC transporter substrate-binding protein [Bradyrhizobium sp. WYCCWR 12699]MDT4740293.1 ABC transporter substrate-binding protein [Bradyrhizobium sp. WYCCWR 12699]
MVKRHGYPQVAADIVSTHPDVIFASGTPVAVQLKKITQSIPIVSVSADPIALGLVSSLARPGGNLTGASIDAGLELHGKRFQPLTEMIPSLSKIYYLASAGYWEREAGIAARSAARRVGIPVIELPLGRTVSQRAYEEVLLSLQPGERSALLVSDEGEHLPLRQSLVDLIAARHPPACYPFREFVEAGGLMSYSVDLADLFRLMAAQASDILEGKKPSEIPVYQPTKFELAINARAAKALNLDLSPSFLAQADHVLE